MTRRQLQDQFDAKWALAVAPIVSRTYPFLGDLTWEDRVLGFRALLIALLLVLGGYTALVVARYGLDLLPIFFGDISKIGWPGQFNLDFLCFLTLSALWTAWRNAFSPFGWMLALVAFFGGAGFLLPYLLILTVRSRGDMTMVMLGKPRD